MSERTALQGLVGAMLFALSGFGCASSGSTWNDAGYRQSAFGYAVAFRDAQTRSIAGPDWQLDNHHYDAATDSWEEKTGADYMATREQDLNQDGTIGIGEKNEEPIYDLKLVNKKNDGVIWTKAHPFLPERAERDLEVVLDDYVDSLAGHGLYAQGNLFGVEHEKIRNFTTFLVSKKIERVGSVDMLTGTIEIAEVDRLKLDPAHRRSVVKLVLVKIRCFTIGNCRAGFVAERTGSDDPEVNRWPIVDCRGKPCRARTGLLIVGYSNSPSYFAAGVPDFDDLVKRISFPDAQPLAVPALRAKPPDTPPMKPLETPTPKSPEPAVPEPASGRQ